MNIVTPVTVARPVTVTVTPYAFDQFLAAENAAWDAYEADLAVTQEVQDALEVAGSYRALHALEAALAVARAEYESAAQATLATLPIHEVTGLLEAQHGLTVKHYKRDYPPYPRVIAIVADDAARLFADSDPATQVTCYPNGRTVYRVAVGGWAVQFEQLDAPLPPAPPAPPIPLDNVDVDTMSLSELEAAMLARVVTGDDGLDHYL